MSSAPVAINPDSADLASAAALVGTAAYRAPAGLTVDLAKSVSRPWPTFIDLGISVLVCGAHLILADSYYTATTALCCGLEASVLALLVTRYARVRPPRLPWIEYIFAIHYSEFGLPIIAGPSSIGLRKIAPRAESYEFGALIALLSGLAMILAFGVVRRATRRFDGMGPLAKLDANILARSGRIHMVIAAAYILIEGRVSGIRSALTPVANVIQQFFFHVPLVVVATLTYVGKPLLGNRIQMILALGTVALAAAYSSMLGDVVVPCITVAALWWCVKGKVPAAALALAVGILLVVQPAKSHYRNLRAGPNPEVSVIGGWQQAFAEASAESTSATSRGEHGFQQTIDRVGELANLAYVVEVVPDAVPHTGGIVYLYVLESAIPRLLWPDKPNMTDQALTPFAVALGMMTPEVAESGSVTGLTLPAQGYIEHGLVGTFAWMALLGAVLAALSRYFGTKLAGVLAGTCVMGPMGQSIGGGFYNIFGGLWQAVLGATLLTWLLWALGGGHRRPQVARGGVK